MRPHPHLYEANALVLLRRLSQKYRRKLTLSSVPEEEWRRFRDLGFDFLWLMGVWERSPAGRRVALEHPGLRADYDRVLPGWTEADVAGSPYAVHSYHLDPDLGTDGELSQLKALLNRLGLGLVLDFVPNHLALDHPWTVSYPERFVQGAEDAVRTHPDWHFLTGGGVYLAHGRDPYFPPWTDTVQVNFFSADLREALINELLRIARVADGVRCDMAILGLNSVFQQVWGEAVPDWQRPPAEFWPEAINRVKERRAEFLFLAEAYWGLENTLLDMGFDYAYDKALYDHLRRSSPAEIRGYLERGDVRHPRCVRFTENHDEARAVTGLGRERSLAAATAVATLPGLRLFHDGQLEGKQVRLPVQLGREPEEAPDPAISAFYQRLLAIGNSPVFHEGEWRMLQLEPAWEGDSAYHNLLAWTWDLEEQRKIVVVNFAPTVSQVRLKLPLPGGTGRAIVFRDELNDAVYVRDVDELQNQGLYVELGPWEAHILDVEGE